MQNNKFYSGGFLYNPKTQSVLLHLRDDKTPSNPNRWSFFGGTNEGNESTKECFIRELEEELGIKVKEKEIKYLWDYLNKEHNTWRYVFYIESEKDKSEMTLNEGVDFDWISLDKVFEYNLTENVRQDLKRFIRLQQ